MGFTFGVYSYPKVTVYASGFSDTFNVPAAAGAIGLTEVTDSHGAYDGTTFTLPYDGTYLAIFHGKANGTDTYSAYISFNGDGGGGTSQASPNTSPISLGRIVTGVQGNTIAVYGDGPVGGTTGRYGFLEIVKV